MRKLVRCTACNYVMAEDRLKDVCPACGALRKVFVPYEDPMSERRRRTLELDLHPVAVHFPIAFAASLVVIAVMPFILSGAAERLFRCTGQILSLFLPLLVIAAFLTGLLDGKIRFRRVDRSPYLRRKILLGILFFVASVGLALLFWLGGDEETGWLLATLVVAAAAFACAFALGLIGAQLTGAAFPGK